MAVENSTQSKSPSLGIQEGEIILQTHDISKSYKGVLAVDKANMSVRKGDIYGFVGENGAGKTTILRMVSGIANPTSGGYSLFGIDSKDPKILRARSRIGGIIETPSLYRSASALENLSIQARLAGICKTEEELNAILLEVGLDQKALGKKKAGSFSLGMRQRLGVAMSLVSDPELLLLDEPMNGLDPQGFHDIRELILRLHAKGVTFLVSSHILSELEKICTRVGFLSHGRILEELSVEELHSKSRRKIVISSSDIALPKEALSKALSLKEAVEENGKLAIYDEIDINKVMQTLVKNNILINAISVVDESIEDYYRNLIIGGVAK